MNTMIELHGTITEDLKSLRLDQALARLFPTYSRTQLQHWIRADYVKLDGKICNNIRQIALDQKSVNITAYLVTQEHWEAEPIPLDILYEDEDLFIINKPPGLVVHPGAGIPNRTLANALLHHAPELKTVPRAGLVHRLDKNTSGLLVVARHLSAHHGLIQQMKSRAVIRIYEALVYGHPAASGTIDKPIGRHPTHRTKMAIVQHGGKPAVTHYQVLKHYADCAHMRIRLETGRTHQIRVHMADMHHPIVGDSTYPSSSIAYTHTMPSPEKRSTTFTRQALHATTLTLTHPNSHERRTWTAPLPPDMEKLIATL